MVAGAGGFEVAVGSSGTILNVAEMIRAHYGSEPLRQVGMTSFTAEALAEVVEDLASRPRVADRIDVPGLDPRRADIILGGVIVLEQVFKVLGITELVSSDYALREGVLLDVVRRRQAGTLGHLRTDRGAGRPALRRHPAPFRALRRGGGVAGGSGHPPERGAGHQP
jgi:exopolyphosphatase/pppGpp-phosphohydrolase